MSELPEKDISNVVAQCRSYSTISCRGLCLSYLKKDILNVWWSSVGSILQEAPRVVCELPEDLNLLGTS